MVKVNIISGFLGAGKTTLIKKLIAGAMKNEKVILLENEYGDGAFDHDLDYAEGLFDEARMEAFHALYVQILENMVHKKNNI